MPADRRLALAFAPVAERIKSDDDMARKRAVDAAVSRDGNVVTPALSQTLRLMQTWWLPGAVATGINVEREIVWPQTAVPLQFSARVKSAPTGSELRARLVADGADGAEIAVVTIQPDSTVGTSPLSGAMITAGQLVTVDILAVGVTTPGTSLTLTLAYGPA